MGIPTNCKFVVGLKAVLLFAVVGLCLFGYALRYHCKTGAVLSIVEVFFTRSDTQWMFCSYLAIWCACFVALTFGLKDILLVGLLLIAAVLYVINYGFAFRSTNAVIFLGSITLGSGVRVIFKQQKAEDENQNSKTRTFLIGLVVLLAFSSWWHLDMTDNSYHGPRWMGLWNNPNIYGMLMGAGVVLAIGLLATNQKVESRKQKAEIILLWIAAGMMAVGLVMSYSRGAWAATTVGLLYLAWCYGKLKWRFMLLCMLAAAAVVVCFWHSTADTAPWYLKRLDFSRSSAQHRVSAWRGAVQMMLDHPLGVGWNQAVRVYDKNYSPPAGGAAALTMNSYLMLGTELGLPGLLCFVAYVGLCFRSPRPKVQSPKLEGGTPLAVGCWTLDATQVACRAAALVFVVAFWFDGGLFNLPTASVFWILLELGTSELVANRKCLLQLPSHAS
jgi:hypothetical protein